MCSLARCAMNLTDVNMSGRKELTIESIGTLVTLCKKIQILNLAYCNLMTDGVLILIGVFCKQLRELHMQAMNKCTTSGYVSLVNLCKKKH